MFAYLQGDVPAAAGGTRKQVPLVVQQPIGGPYSRLLNGLDPFGTLVGAFVIIGFAVLVVVGLRRRPAEEPSVSHTDGTAQFSPLVTDVRDETCLRKGVFLGKSSAPEWRGAASKSAHFSIPLRRAARDGGALMGGSSVGFA